MATSATEHVVSKSHPEASALDSHLNTDAGVSKPLSRESEGLSDSSGTTPKGTPDPQASGQESVKSSSDDEETVVERPVKTAAYVGWKQVGGWEEKDRLTPEDMLLDLNKETMLGNVLSDSMFGDWYHSVGLFFAGGFLSFLLGFFRFSIAPVFFVMVFTSVLYRTSIKKYRNSIRELVQKELTVQKVEDDYESMEWLNNFLDKFWPRIEPSVSQMVAEQVNAELAKNEAVPGFIKVLWIATFTLGVKPPRIDLVKTFQNTEPDIAVMDWVVSFTPHDLSDLDAKQFRNYVNQKVVVKAKAFGITLPFVVEDISFKAHVRVRMKMMTPFPHVDTVNVQLLDVPDIDFVLKLFADNIFTWELLAIPGLQPFINEMAKKYAGPILLPPFSFQLNVPQLLSGSSLSIGVLQLHVKGAKDLKYTGNTAKSVSSDLYLEFSFNGAVVGTTKVVKGTTTPVWDESLYILLGSFTDPLSITLFSKREKLKDKLLGRIQYNLSSLHDEPEQKDCSARILYNSKPVGELSFGLSFHPTLEPKKLPDGSVEDLPDLNTGITKIVIDEAKLKGKDKKPSTYVELYLNAKQVLKTSVVKSTSKPKFGAEHETVIFNRRKTRAKLVVKSANGEVISQTIQTLNDLIDRTHVDLKSIPLQDGKGEIKITTHWKPVILGGGSESTAYIPPIGVIRVLANKAEGLRNLEKFGKIDPYAKLLINGTSRARTTAAKSTLNPIWNESLHVSVTSPNQRLTLECMDVESAGSDRTLGKFDIKVTDLFQKGSDDRYIEHLDDEPKFGRLVSKKGAKGTVTYYLSFYPALPVLSLEEIDELDSINQQKEKLDQRKKELQNCKKATSEAKKKLEEEEKEIKMLEEMFGNKLKLELNELLQYQSGVFAFTILGGELPQGGCYIQAFFDSAGHPNYSSSKFNSKIVNVCSSGDAFIKELQWSVATFRITKDGQQNKAENFLAELTIPTIELVRNCYYKPSFISLTGNQNAKLMLQASWFPVTASKLPRADLITNTGDLTINIHSANRLISADRNGKSDPYVKFYLDDKEECLYKTKVQKKTLDPTWGESTTIQINNRVNNYLKIKMMDWDAGNSDDLIGTAVVPLSNIDPDNETFMDVPLEGPDGEDGGVLNLTFRFAPRYTTPVTKVETKVGDIANKGLSAGLHAGSTVIGSGLSAVGKLKKGVLGTGKKDKGKANA